MILLSELNWHQRAIRHHFRLRNIPENRRAARIWIAAYRDWAARCGWRAIEKQLKKGDK